MILLKLGHNIIVDPTIIWTGIIFIIFFVAFQIVLRLDRRSEDDPEEEPTKFDLWLSLFLGFHYIKDFFKDKKDK